jgi:hypothetical protein
MLDDLGRRCVSRETARRLFAERAESERRDREAQERHQAKLAGLVARKTVRGAASRSLRGWKALMRSSC